MARKFSRPHRLEWPLTPEQLGNVDETLDHLYRLLRSVGGDLGDTGVVPGTYGDGGEFSGGGGGGGTISDTVANKPAAGTAGQLFLPTDGIQIERDSGSAWSPWGPIFPFTAPVDADFSWVNQGTASVDTTNGGIYLLTPADTTVNIRARVKTAPSTPYTITAAFLPMILRKEGHQYGLCFRQSSTGALHTFMVFTGPAGTLRFASSKYTNPTTLSANYDLSDLGVYLTWMRIADNGTNRICSYSMDGQHWIQFHSVGRTDFLTADQVGFFANGNNAATPNLPAAVTLMHWKEA